MELLARLIGVSQGWVIYLNGGEIYRTNIAASIQPVTYESETLRALDDSLAFYPPSTSKLPYFALPMTNLVQGWNHIAVEIHQSSARSGGASFGLELSPSYFRWPAPDGRLRSRLTEGGGLRVFWDDETRTLESSPSLSTGLWRGVTHGVSSVVVPLGEAATFFRLRPRGQ